MHMIRALGGVLRCGPSFLGRTDLPIERMGFASERASRDCLPT